MEEGENAACGPGGDLSENGMRPCPLRFFLHNIDDWLAAISMAGLIGLMFVSIFMRYVFRHPFMWSEEVIALIFMWVIMIGAVSSMKTRRHLSVDLLVVEFPLRIRACVDILVKLAVAGVLLVMVVYGWSLSMEARDKITNMLSISYTYIDLAVPVGSVGMLCYLGRDLRHDWRALTRGEEIPPIRDRIAEAEQRAF